MTDFLLLPLSERLKQFQQIVSKHPEMIPVIIFTNDKATPQIEKKKFLAHKDMTVGQLLVYLKSKIQLKHSEALYIFIDDKLVNGSQLISEMYRKYPAKDGFLYVKYACENTFGYDDIKF